MIIFAAKFNHNIMKHLNTIVIILLNILFCFGLLWFFTRNAFLRPYAGTTLKEAVAGLLLLGSLYANYFLLYPKLHQKHSHNFYWLSVFFIALATGTIELAIAYQNISLCNAEVVPPKEKTQAVFSYIQKHFNCNSGDIVTETNMPLSTVERCIAVLKKQNLIEYSGSRKTGGYRVVER